MILIISMSCFPFNLFWYILRHSTGDQAVRIFVPLLAGLSLQGKVSTQAESREFMKALLGLKHTIRYGIHMLCYSILRSLHVVDSYITETILCVQGRDRSERASKYVIGAVYSTFNYRLGVF